MIRILLVDDHELVRTGLRFVLTSRPGYEVMGEASTGEEAIEIACKDCPNIVLMDIHMPGIGGIEATRRILEQCPSTKVLTLTSLSGAAFPSALHDAGALGYVCKGCHPEELFDGIKTVMQGRPFISADVAKKLSINLFTKQHSPFVALSVREMEVVMQILTGKKTQTIARILDLSPKTISTFRQRIYSKLGISSDVELTLAAVRHGLLTEELQ